MAIFRESITGPGRSVEDRRRHRQLVEQSIKKNIGQIIAEESIIGQSGQKKIKVPIKSIKEFQFIYGKNRHGVGTGTGEEQRGDVLDENKPGNGQGNQGAGSEAGEDIYETEITLEELVNYLFDDLDLPFMERQKIADMDTIANKKRSGYQHKGPPPRLAKKRAMVEKIKRRQGSRRAENSNHPKTENGETPSTETRFPFRDEDLRYHRIREEHVLESNAVVICIMDTSGSMDQTKKYLARSFYFLLYQFIRLKYLQVEVVFIAHTTQAVEVSEDEFFHKGESGGTYISSGYEKALRIIEERYPPEKWNIYAFHCSDGDNWDDDNEKAVKMARQLCEVCNLFGYGEIMTGYSSIKSIFREQVQADNFAIVSIGSRDDIWPALRDLLAREDKSHE